MDLGVSHLNADQSLTVGQEAITFPSWGHFAVLAEGKAGTQGLPAMEVSAEAAKGAGRKYLGSTSCLCPTRDGAA